VENRCNSAKVARKIPGQLFRIVNLRRLLKRAEESLEERGTGLAAMADGKLDVDVEIGHGLVE
jgi:hypothetical protein